MKKPKIRSKSKIVQNILEIVFKNFCDNEEIAILIQEYYASEKKAAERKAKRNDIMISKSLHRTYRISKEVRDWLEPMVDAEYFKDLNYTPNLASSVIYEAMQQLETKAHKKLIKKIQKELENERSGRIRKTV